jgi:tripartite-type tricarboxylate transporter receptor subunit TctC
MCGALIASVSAAPAVDFAGPRIEILVPTEPGGGTDIYARFLGPLLSEKLPGKPTIIINNVPGAGSIAGGNQFQKRARPDGLSLIAIGTSITTNYVFRDKRVQFKLEDWIPIISSPQGTVVYSSKSLSAKKPDDIVKLRGEKLVMGANNAAGGDMRVLLSLDSLGMTVNPVFGLNRGEVRPGFERGEFNINWETTAGYQVQVLPMVESGEAVPLFTFGVADDSGKILRDPVVPNLPTYIEVYHSLYGKDPEGPPFKAWLAMFDLNVMAAKALALPAGTPKEIVDTYNEAIKAVVAEFGNPQYKKQADDIVGPYPQALGAAAGRALKGAVTLDDETFAWLKGWLASKYQVKL